MKGTEAMTTNSLSEAPQTSGANLSNAAAPESRFVQLAPGCYIVYVAGMRFMVNTELAARLGCSIAKECHPDTHFRWVASALALASSIGC
jgi:hypothetical protein